MGFLKSKTKGNTTTEKSKKKSWFGNKKASTTEQKGKKTSSSQQSVSVLPTPNDLSINESHSSDSLPTVPVALMKNTQSFDKKLLRTEQKIHKQIQDASKRKDLKLQSTGGVLLFEGMNHGEADEYTAHELKQNDSEITGVKSYDTDFVGVPRNYDPVKNGFYSKKKQNYYDSDEEDTPADAQEQRKVSNTTGSCSTFWGFLGGS